MMDTADLKPIDQWPGVELAYGWAPASYEMMFRRMETIETRIRAFLTTAATFMFAAPALLHTSYPNSTVQSSLFIGALLCFVGVAISGIVGQVGTSVTGPSPKAMHDNMLHLGDWEFKQAAIYRAGEAFELNRRTVNRKGFAADTAGALLLAEAVFLILWMVQQAA